MKILLLGKNGQVGWELQRALSPLGELVALDADSTGLCGDFTRPDDLAHTIRSVQPQVIVNAAAYTAVDKAESEPALARLINADGPALLAREAHALGAWLLHYSTDYVFDGSGNTPWTESDAPAPRNVYGQTKLEGERAVQTGCAKHLILRTSWVYAARGGNFAKTMLRLAREREVLNVIDDQVGAPTGAELLADVSVLALRQLQQRPQDAGLYHCTAAGATSWLEYANAVLGQVQLAQTASKLIANGATPQAWARLQRIASANYPVAAQRPLNSRLDCSRLCTTFDLTLPPWQQGVARMLTEILERETAT